MDESFESRVWGRALAQGLLSTDQINQCLKEFKAHSPTLQLTEILVAKGHLTADQVAALRGSIATDGPDLPDDVRIAARDPGNLLGRYVLLGELGRGGMGIVYKAWDGDLRRRVALKVLSGPWTAEDLARFRREAQSAAALRHPNIITVYEIGPSDENPYIALELIDGRSLHGRKVPSRKAAELMVVIARAVEAAHRQGIIHRDLKPANIMIDAEGLPRVMDFGLAKSERSSSKITMSGTVIGTPAYMSPEQAQGRTLEIDHRTDVYSLGAMLYELLTGRAPFGGGTPLETLTAVVEQAPVPPRRLDPSVPKPVEAVLLQCLRKNRLERYPTAEALAQDLERFLAGKPVKARAPSSPSLLVGLASAAVAFLLALAFLLRPTEAAPVPRLPPGPDRNQLDRGLRLMEECRLDLYRAGAALDRTQERLKEAETCFDAALAADPSSGEAWLARAESRSRQNRFKASLPDYAEAIRLLPTSPAALLARGQTLLEHFMDERSTANWMKADLPPEIRAEKDQARADFLKARSLSPSKGVLAFLQICLELIDDRNEQAIDLATAAIPAAERPEELYKLRGDAFAAKALLQFGKPAYSFDLAKAVDDYGEAIRLRANYLEAYRRRGASRWMLGRTDEALSDFEAMLRMKPGDSVALSDLATAYHRGGRHAEALETFTRAIAADPENLRAYTNRGSLYLQFERLKEAREDLERAIRINPRHLAAQYNLAVVLWKQKDRETSLKRLDAILGQVPNFSKGFSIRCVVHAELGHFQAAIDDGERALALEPGLAEQLRPVIDACRKRLQR